MDTGRENRKHRRRVLQVQAWIDTGAGTSPLACRVDDISQAGARLTVTEAEAAALPEAFILLLSEKGFPRRSCRAIWREACHVGVNFVAASAKAQIPSAMREAPAAVPLDC